MRTENVQGISERDHDEEQYIYKLVIGPKNKEWWVDYLPEPFPLQINPTDFADAPPETEPMFNTARSGTLAPTDINDFESDSDSENILLIFRDGLDQPIPGLQIATEGVNAIGERTDDNGTLQIAPTKKHGKVSIIVKDIKNNQQRICEIDLSKRRNEIKIQSPKVFITAESAPTYEKNPHGPGVYSSGSDEQSAIPWYQRNGALKKSGNWLMSVLHIETNPIDRAGGGNQPHRISKTTTNAGHPTTVIVGPEVDEKYNLRLGENNVYRDIIIKAAKRLNIVPHAICCLLECEANRRIEKVPATDKSGSHLYYKYGKNKGRPIFHYIPHEWDADSFCSSTNAGGLSQFLPSTWLYCTLKPGHFISDQSVILKKPWIKEKAGKRYFVLEQGITTKPQNFKSDKNVQMCLSMRFTPEWSIMAAADYASDNFSLLKKDNQLKSLDRLSDGEKIKIMYLLHHEGPLDGIKFIKNSLVVSDKKLASNVGSKDHWLNLSLNDKNQAYRLWLADYIDKRIVFSRFAFNTSTVEQCPPLLEIIQKVY